MSLRPNHVLAALMFVVAGALLYEGVIVLALVAAMATVSIANAPSVYRDRSRRIAPLKRPAARLAVALAYALLPAIWIFWIRRVDIADLLLIGVGVPIATGWLIGRRWTVALPLLLIPWSVIGALAHGRTIHGWQLVAAVPVAATFVTVGVLIARKRDRRNYLAGAATQI